MNMHLPIKRSWYGLAHSNLARSNYGLGFSLFCAVSESVFAQKLRIIYSSWQNRAVLKAIDYYQACLSKASVDAQGDGYLKEVVAMLGGSNLTTPNWNSSGYNVQKAMLTAITKLGSAQPFFHLDVYPDFSNSSKKSFAVCITWGTSMLTAEKAENRIRVYFRRS